MGSWQPIIQATNIDMIRAFAALTPTFECLVNPSPVAEAIIPFFSHAFILAPIRGKALMYQFIGGAGQVLKKKGVSDKFLVTHTLYLH